ncbi:Serine hydroxymethyltransferase [uncultured archaeon]|nr:Serine hydroxymethyltransferase [uncultured archaeon]
MKHGPYVDTLSQVDPEVYEAIRKETIRQNTTLQLIASESPSSLAVLAASGSVMTNKYAEGYPHKRYYGGCEYMDTVEDLAIERAKKIFGCEHVNVQPHSGSQANAAAYMAVMKPGDTLLGMDLSHGGHLTHGHPLSFSGILYKATHYTVSPKTETLDMAEVAAKAREVKPKVIVTGYSAYPRTIDFKAFREVADEVGAYLVADIAHIAGLVAAGAHPSPVPYADFVTTTTHKTLRGPRGAIVMCKEAHAKALDKAVFPGLQGGPFMHLIAAKAVAFNEALQPEWKKTQNQVVVNAKKLCGTLSSRGFRMVSGGTDNHLMLVDVTGKKLTGKEAEAALGAAGITVNKNTIPFDKNPPFVASGVRIGTPSVSYRGMKEAEMDLIGGFIADVLEQPANAEVAGHVKKDVLDLCGRFPLYPL